MSIIIGEQDKPGDSRSKDISGIGSISHYVDIALCNVTGDQ